MRFLSCLLLLSCLVFPQVLTADAVHREVYYSGENASYFETDFPWGEENMNVLGDFLMRHVPGENATEIRLRPLRDPSVNYPFSLAFPRGVRACQKIIFRLRNLGDKPLGFHPGWLTSREGVVGTTNYYGWYFHYQPELPPDGEWHEYVFSVAPEAIGGNAPEALSPLPLFRPFGKFVFWMGPVNPGELIHVQIGEIRGEDEVACQGRVQWEGELPETLVAGEDFVLPGFRAEFQGRAPLLAKARLTLLREGQDPSVPPVPVELEDVRQEGMVWSRETASLALTPFLREGTYRIRLECGEAELENMEWTARIQGRNPELPRMSVRPWKGRPTIFQGEEPVPGIMRATYTTEGPEGIRVFSQAGVNLFGFCSTPTEGGYGLETLTEYAPGRYDYAQFDSRMRNTLAVNPDAMVIVRLYLHAPLWWTAAHPEEVAMVANPFDKETPPAPFVWHQGRPVPSWASALWRDYTETGLRNMIQFIRESPYADRVAGFVLASGHTEEWMEWGSFDNRVGDYSRPAREAFRRWLTRKYGNDDALRKAWGDPRVTLETAAMPLPWERFAAAYAGVRPLGSPDARRHADYLRYHSENVAECIERFCRVVKEATENRLLVGAFYGYYVELAGSIPLMNSGHLAVGKLMESPWLDFLCSPTGYQLRQVGGAGLSYPLGAADTLQLHNKFWFVENDIRTYDTPNVTLGRPDTPEGDVLQQHKEVLHNLLSGMAQWWFDVGHIQFHSPLLLDAITELTRVSRKITLEYSRESVAQVALVLDEPSLDWVTMSCPPIHNAALMNQKALSTMGTPYEVYLASDLERLPARLRLLILPTSFQEDPRQTEILEKLKAEGRSILFLGTPGIIPCREDSTPTEAARRITGLPLEYFRQNAAPAKLHLLARKGWLEREETGSGFPTGTWQDGDGQYIVGRLTKNFPGLIRLGRDAAGNAIAGALENPAGGVTAFCCSFTAPEPLLAALMRRAGIHRYVESGDQVWASPEVLAVCVKDGGEKRISLPDKTLRRATDLMSGEVFPVDEEGVFYVRFAPLATRVFHLER
ncbi:MAG: beta-galactosidase [Oligosphaeraceae bacterium]